MLAGKNISIVSQTALGVCDADESGLSFAENAIIKARHAARQTSLPAIADDSGIEVDLLEGRPGIYSARYAGPGANDEENLALLLDNLKQYRTKEIKARFHCAMIYMRHAEDPAPLIAQGTWHGVITWEPKGENGFGYDPVFYLPDYDCTSAELPPELKNKISHRGQALRLLLELLSAILD